MISFYIEPVTFGVQKFKPATGIFHTNSLTSMVIMWFIEEVVGNSILDKPLLGYDTDFNAGVFDLPFAMFKCILGKRDKEHWGHNMSGKTSP